MNVSYSIVKPLKSPVCGELGKDMKNEKKTDIYIMSAIAPDGLRQRQSKTQYGTDTGRTENTNWYEL